MSMRSMKFQGRAAGAKITFFAPCAERGCSPRGNDARREERQE